MNDELTVVVADELDVFLRDRGMFIGREDLEELADIVIGVVDSYESPDEDDDDAGEWSDELGVFV